MSKKCLTSTIRLFFFVSFILLILPGMGRLLETDGAPSALPESSKSPVHYMQSYLVCPDTMQKEVSSSQQSTYSGMDEQVALQEHDVNTDTLSPDVRDANGNVLQEKAYYLSIYNAFSPGDAKT